MPDNKQSPRCPYCGAEMKTEKDAYEVVRKCQ